MSSKMSVAGEHVKSGCFRVFDKISHLLDPIFATSLIAEGVLLILSGNNENNIQTGVLIAYFM